MKRIFLLVIGLLIVFSFSLSAQPGTLDMNFAGDGIQFFQFGSNGTLGRKVLVDDAGIIWVAAENFNSAQQMGLAKILPDGTPDESFNFDGAISVNVEGMTANASNLARQADGKIILVGGSALNGGDFAVARINPDGTLDDTFGGGDGRLTIDFDGLDVGQAVAVQSDGKILLAGYHYDGVTFKIAVARLNVDGSLDANFAGDGKQVLLFDAEDSAFDIALLPDGKILLAGYTAVSPDIYDFALFRLNPDGSPDSSFDMDGRANVDVNGPFETALSMVIQPDGKIVLAGWSGNGFAIARFLPDGTPDTSFSFDGVNYTEFEGVSGALDLVVQPDGRIVVAGSNLDTGLSLEVFCIIRYLPDGLLDPEFGINGVAKFDLDENSQNEYASGIALQPDGKLVVVGTGAPAGENQMAIIRILSGLNVGLFERGLEKIQSYVYPNPVSAGEEVQLAYELRAGTEVYIELVDQLGRAYPLFSGDRAEGSQSEALQLPAGLGAGIYYLHIRTENGQSSVRLHIQ